MIINEYIFIKYIIHCHELSLQNDVTFFKDYSVFRLPCKTTLSMRFDRVFKSCRRPCSMTIQYKLPGDYNISRNLISRRNPTLSQ